MTRRHRCRRDDEGDRSVGLDVHLRVPRTWVYACLGFVLGCTVTGPGGAEAAAKLLHLFLTG